MARVLITGGAGYVGSHCAKAIHAAGYECAVFDNLSTGHRDFVKWGPLIIGDIRNRAELEKVFREYEFDAVLHFAGLSSVAESMAFPDLYHQNNVDGTRALLTCMLRSGVRKLVFSSSCAIYGIPACVPVSEETEPKPISPYGASKLLCEETIREFAADGAFHFVSLRYFNAAGADPSGEIGEDHERESRLIPLALDAASGRGSFVSLFGTDYDTPDGSAIRDYIHVCDLATAHLAALHYLMQNRPSTTLNLGTMQGQSVRSVLDTVEQVTGLKVPVQISAARPGDPPLLIANAGVAQKLLHWKPVRSDLSVIIGDAWAWHRRRFRHQIRDFERPT